MNDLFEKYADVLLNTCLKVEKEQPLFISYNKERQDFVDVIVKRAKESCNCWKLQWRKDAIQKSKVVGE